MKMGIRQARKIMRVGLTQRMIHLARTRDNWALWRYPRYSKAYYRWRKWTKDAVGSKDWSLTPSPRLLNEAKRLREEQYRKERGL